MRITSLLTAVVALIGFSVFAVADENHEIIEKVMVDGMKGDDSPLAKVLDGKATDEEIKGLAELFKTLEGTKPPLGDQAKYDEKVAELIAAMDAVAGGDKGNGAIDRLDTAANCKACHTDHRPKD